MPLDWLSLAQVRDALARSSLRSAREALAEVDGGASIVAREPFSARHLLSIYEVRAQIHADRGPASARLHDELVELCASLARERPEAVRFLSIHTPAAAHQFEVVLSPSLDALACLRVVPRSR